MPVIYFCKVFHFVVVPPFFLNNMVRPTRPMYSNGDGFADGVLEQIEGMVREFLATVGGFSCTCHLRAANPMHAMKSTRNQRRYLPCDDVATEKLGSTELIQNPKELLKIFTQN